MKMFNIFNKKAFNENVEFYPPDGLDSATIAYIYGNLSISAIVSLFISFANNGLIRIVEEKRRWKVEITIIKTWNVKRELENKGLNEYEIKLLSNMFGYNKNEVKVEDLGYHFQNEIKVIFKHIKDKNMKIVFDKFTLRWRSIMYIIMIGCIFAGLTLLIFAFIIVIFFNNVDLTKFIVVSTAILPATLVFSVAGLLLVKRRTDYGKEMLCRIRRFKYFIENAEREKLENLVAADPEYFYKILPYANALGVSHKWFERFKNIATPPPVWYSGKNTFSAKTFSNIIKTLCSKASPPSDSSG